MSYETFTAFYRRYYRLILTVAEQRLAGFSDAEDVTAEVFRIAWAHHQEGKPLTLAWTYQVLRNVIGNEYRRASRSDQLVDRVGTLLWLDSALESGTDDALQLRSALRELPEGDRELMYLAYWEDLTRTEIAEILGIAVGAVRVRLTRAKRRLRALLDVSDASNSRKEGGNGRA